MRKKNYSASRQEDSVEKQVGKEPKKNKQMVALDFVVDNYAGILRFDDVAKKAQIFQIRDINENKGSISTMQEGMFLFLRPRQTLL